MSSFECDNCHQMFKRKENLEYHVKKSVCMQQKEEIFECKFCQKRFTTSTSMYRHMNHTCKIKKQDDIEKSQIYERLLRLEENNRNIVKENKQLKKEVDSLRKNVVNVSKITNNTQNINNGIVAHINLIGYGKEDLSKIDKKEILKAMQSGFDSTIRLTETLHFNPKHPEYHNIYITNVKDKYAMMFDGKDWNLTMKDELINKIYDDKKNYIEENLDDFIDSLSISRKKALDRWLTTEEDDDRINKVKNEIKLLLYNKRGLVIEKHEENAMGSKKIVKSCKKLIKKE